MAKVLITDDVHPLLIKGLQERDYAVDFMPNITARRNALTVIANYTGLIINSKIYCGEELLAKATQLKWISRLGSGMEVIDTELCDATWNTIMQIHLKETAMLLPNMHLDCYWH
jgi:D-3-phosphoglycerate dehydrogenase